MRRLAKAAMASASLALAVPVAAQAPSSMPVINDGETLVLVEAHGTTEVVPDYMVVEAGVVTSRATAREAVDENNRKMQRVIEALRTDGIRPSEVRTTDFAVSPRYRDRNETEIVAYEVRNELWIELRDFARAGDTISALFDAGANSVSGPRFRIDPDTELVAADAAQRDAIDFARNQAERVAEQLGLRVSRVLRVSDRDIRFNREYGGDSGGFIVVTGSRIASTPIEPGVMPFHVDLYIEFALVPN